jgi:hypothetical protein
VPWCPTAVDPLQRLKIPPYATRANPIRLAQIDRKKLGPKIFESEANRLRLNGIVWPAIMRLIR